MLRNIPLGGFTFRRYPGVPALELQGMNNQFCTDPGLLPRLRLDLNPQECENNCLLGTFPQQDTARVPVAHLPALRRGPGTFDVLVETYLTCQGGTPVTTFRMPMAIRYGGLVGDCDGDDAVMIDELVLGVNLALGEGSLADCIALDANDSGDVEIHELIAAVGAALQS